MLGSWRLSGQNWAMSKTEFWSGFLVEKFNISQTSKKKDFARKHVFNVEYSDEFWITKKKSLTPFLHKKLLFQTVFCYLQFRTAPQYKGPFTLVIFAAILAAISSAILRRFQIARVNCRRGIARARLFENWLVLILD